MVKPKVFIRAEGGANIGLGHIIRCLALADIIKSDFSIHFIISNNDPKIVELIRSVTNDIIFLPKLSLLDEWKEIKKIIKPNDVLVIDGYDFKEEYQKLIKQNLGCTLIAIDDLHAWHQYADAVINHAVGGIENLYSKENYTKVYCGLDYALLRSEFKKAPPTKKEDGTVLVAMGGADPYNFTKRIVNSLLPFTDIKTINALIGKLNPNKELLERSVSEAKQKGKELVLIDHLSASELATLYGKSAFCILSSSGMAIEALAVGANLGVIKTANNQSDFYNYIIKNKLAKDCSVLAEAGAELTEKSIASLMEGSTKQNSFSAENSSKNIKQIFSQWVANKA